ncbi:hypothetical protein K474DRAFT_1666547 [Panus rudis PR-1116 ss-1]|nr:hypothetical protein K474DRAFT_1666547 [Panus rudis PR-1116 ss-1]
MTKAGRQKRLHAPNLIGSRSPSHVLRRPPAGGTRRKVAVYSMGQVCGIVVQHALYLLQTCCTPSFTTSSFAFPSGDMMRESRADQWLLRVYHVPIPSFHLAPSRLLVQSTQVKRRVVRGVWHPELLVPRDLVTHMTTFRKSGLREDRWFH